MFNLSESSTLHIKQKRELAELFGFETKNQYLITDQDEVEIGLAAELSPHWGHFFMRQFFGHWRKFHAIFFDSHSNKLLTATHPFKFFLQELHITDHASRPLGVIKQRFSIFYKQFDILGQHNRVLLSVKSPWFKFWTFEITKMNRPVAMIKKTMGKITDEIFFDNDNFKVEYQTEDLDPREKNLILASVIFLDLIYFEKKGG